MISYSMEELLIASEEYKEPRCGEKLLLQVNPRVPDNEYGDTVSQITGLTPEMLKKKRSLTERWRDVISYLSTVPEKPACLIAHNGSGFDFRLLKDEINRLGLEDFPNGIYIADSISVIKHIENQYREHVQDQLKSIPSPAPSETRDLNTYRVNREESEKTPEKEEQKPQQGCL